MTSSLFLRYAYVSSFIYYVTQLQKRDCMEEDQQFIDFVVKAIVNNPDDVKTERTVDERGVLITLDLNPSDMGYVIGRQGRTAQSLRTLLKIVGAKNNARVNLKINEPEGGRPPRVERPEEEHAEAHVAAAAKAVNLDDVDISAVDGVDF